MTARRPSLLARRAMTPLPADHAELAGFIAESALYGEASLYID
jgi:hypothetical protein